jgi:hypothetical protein
VHRKRQADGSGHAEKGDPQPAHPGRRTVAPSLVFVTLTIDQYRFQRNCSDIKNCWRRRIYQGFVKVS